MYFVLEMLQAQEKVSCPSSEFVKFYVFFVLEILQAQEKVSCPSSEFVKFHDHLFSRCCKLGNRLVVESEVGVNDMG